MEASSPASVVEGIAATFTLVRGRRALRSPHSSNASEAMPVVGWPATRV